MSDNTIQTEQTVAQTNSVDIVEEQAGEGDASVETIERKAQGQHSVSLANTVNPAVMIKDVYDDAPGDFKDSSGYGFQLLYHYKDNANYMPRWLRGSGPTVGLGLDFLRGNADLLGAQRTQASLQGGYRFLFKDFVYLQGSAGLGLGSLTCNFGKGYVADPAFSSVFQADVGAGVQWQLPIEGLSIYGGFNYGFEQGKSDGIVYKTHAVGGSLGVTASF
ncbi:outer membrane beta-barrel protein [bacterium]|nr:outer membrane beta-barrel protein [bacterium]MBU1918654.1 outer membrane beta-barrel protein [bacterium]